jgi:hypothetical protein
MPGVWTILEWVLYGGIRFVMLWIPGIVPFRVDRPCPTSWWRYNSWSDWNHKDDNRGGPDEHWVNAWFRMVIGEFERLILEEAKPYVDKARDALRSLIGGIRSGFSNMGSWIQWLNDRVGYLLPFWASSLGGGLVWLYDRLPAGIRQGWQSWEQIFENIRSSVRSWVQSVYDEAKGLAFWARDWIRTSGGFVHQWVSDVRTWVDGFRRDPGGYVRSLLGSAWAWLVGFWQNGRGIVLGWLGPDWNRLVTFSQNALTFYYNLWSKGWRILDQIVSDPRAFVADVLEQALEDRW